MARYTFGGDVHDLITAADSSAGGALKIAPNTMIQLFAAATGGSAVTDFMVDVNGDGSYTAATSVSSRGTGYPPDFQGPDGVSVLYYDPDPTDSDARRVRWVARDANTSGAAAATTSAAGIAELADATEAGAGVDDTRIMTPARTAAVVSSAVTTHEAASNPHPTYAPLASPALTGTPTAPTPPSGAASGRIATVGYVNSLAVAGVNLDRATDSSGSLNTTLSSGVLDDVLVVPLAANTRMDIDFTLLVTGDVGDDIQLQLEGPASTTAYGYVTGHNTVATAPGGGRVDYTITALGATTPVWQFATFGATTPSNVRGTVTVKTAATSGNLQFRFARVTNTSGAAGAGTPVKIAAGSSVRAAVIT